MGIEPFFYPPAGDDLIDACIDLALLFKIDPWGVMARPEREINEIYRRAVVRMKHLAAEE